MARLSPLRLKVHDQKFKKGHHYRKGYTPHDWKLISFGIYECKCGCTKDTRFFNGVRYYKGSKFLGKLSPNCIK